MRLFLCPLICLLAPPAHGLAPMLLPAHGLAPMLLPAHGLAPMVLPAHGLAPMAPPTAYALSPQAAGVLEKVNNIVNLTVVTRDPQVLKAEYQAGFIQGHLQGDSIKAARDNTYAGTVPAAQFLASENLLLNRNFTYLIQYLRGGRAGRARQGLTRLLFRMLGIYHGATREQPASLDFSGAWLPDGQALRPEEMQTGYGTPGLTFMDVYFLNAAMDLADIMNGCTSTFPREGGWLPPNQRCTAFLKRAGDEILLAHTTWSTFLSETQAMTLYVNGDGVAMNVLGPGQIASGTDFGYNNKGILFCETTNGRATCQTKVEGLFIFLRAALAEETAGSLDEFFHDLALDNTGTYLNAFQLADARTLESALVDMSEQHFVYFHSSGGPYTVTTLPAGQATGYDEQMVTPDYLLGYNYPPSLLVRDDLQASDSTPDRPAQLQALVPGVTDLGTAMAAITYVNPAVADSIFGRFDLAATANPEPAPFGSIDAKVATASMARAFMALDGRLAWDAPSQGFWMLFGTPHVDGLPFIWSRSQWSSWQHPDVPDVLDGVFTPISLHVR